MGTWEHIKLGELPWHNGLGFFSWGRSLKIHIEIKRELFIVAQLFEFWCCKWANWLLLPWAHKFGEKPNRGIMQPHFSLLGCWKFKPRVNLAGTRLNPPPFLAATTPRPRVLRAILFMALLSRALLPLLSRERPLPSSCDSRTTSRKVSCFLGLSWRADLRWNQQSFLL